MKNAALEISMQLYELQKKFFLLNPPLYFFRSFLVASKCFQTLLSIHISLNPGRDVSFYHLFQILFLLKFIFLEEIEFFERCICETEIVFIFEFY